jgi:hypothetical protein
MSPILVLGILALVFLLMMGLETLTFSRTISGGGINAVDSENVTGDLRIAANPTVLQARPGVLTTRASDTAGTLTMESGHGIITGQRIDIYWGTVGDGNYVTSATVGTVAGLSVPFTLAVGTLPVATTAVRVGIPDEVGFPVEGDDIQGIVAACGTAPALFVFADDAADLLTEYTTMQGAFGWKDGDGTNPLAGDTVTKVFVSVDKTSGSTTDAKAVVILP